MEQINIHAAKTNLSALVEKAAAGKPFVIAKAGKPLVVVSAYNTVESKPRVGFMKGQINVPENFDRMGDDKIEAMFGDAP